MLSPKNSSSTIWKSKLARYPSLVLTAVLAGFCQVSLAQDYDLAAPDTEWREPPVSGGVTLFQNVRIFNGKSGALGSFQRAGYGQQN